MKFSLALSGMILATGLATGALAQNCSHPANPAVPNGKTATEQEMVQGQQAVKNFMADSNAYLACLEEEGASFRDQVVNDSSLSDDEKKDRLAKKDKEITEAHNGAVAKQEKVAAEFNEAVRDYRAAHSE